MGTIHLPPDFKEFFRWSTSGVEFADAFSNRVEDELDGVRVKLINLQDLKRNKKAAGRTKDLADLEELP